MKVRIGFGLGVGRAARRRARFGDARRRRSRRTASTRCGSPSGSAATRPTRSSGSRSPPGGHEQLKLGTSVQVLPGRNPALLAKEWASLDGLSGGRALPAFGLGDREPGGAAGVRRRARGPRADLRRGAPARSAGSGREDAVDHDGRALPLRGITVLPKPAAGPPRRVARRTAPSELRRCRPARRRLARELPARPRWWPRAARSIEEAAAEAGRVIDHEHYGAMVLLRARRRSPTRCASGSRRDPGPTRTAVVAVGFDASAQRLGGLHRGRASRSSCRPAPSPASRGTESSARSPSGARPSDLTPGAPAPGSSWVTSGERARLTVATAITTIDTAVAVTATVPVAPSLAEERHADEAAHDRVGHGHRGQRRGEVSGLERALVEQEADEPAASSAYGCQCVKTSTTPSSSRSSVDFVSAAVSP